MVRVNYEESIALLTEIIFSEIAILDDQIKNVIVSDKLEPVYVYLREKVIRINHLWASLDAAVHNVAVSKADQNEVRIADKVHHHAKARICT